MLALPLRHLTLAALTTLTLAACAYDDGYGYSGLSVGLGSGYGGYYDDYPAYGGYLPYYGWWGDRYYPGVGVYTYDRSGHRYRWNDSQRRYWQDRRRHWRGDRDMRENWSGYHRDGRGVRDRRNDEETRRRLQERLGRH